MIGVNVRIYGRKFFLKNNYCTPEIGIIGFDKLDEVLILSEKNTYYELVGMKKLYKLWNCIGKLKSTKLFNKAFPMIRYDAGDAVSIKTIGEADPFRTN